MKKLIIIALAIRLILLFSTSYHPDLGNHLDWGNRFWQYGPSNFYHQSIWSVSWPNQPLGTIYLFAFIAKINQTLFSFFWYLNTHIPLFPSNLIPLLEKNLHIWLVKLPFIGSDLGSGILVYYLLKKKYKRAAAAAAFFLLNPALIYNSAVWGQTDSLINFLALASLYFLDQKKPSLALFLLLISFLFKFSLTIFLPAFLIYYLKSKPKLSSIILTLTIFLSFSFLLALPFSQSTNPLIWLFNISRDRVLAGQGGMLNGNAFNLWAIIYGIDLSLKESITLLGLSASQIGKLIFAVFSLPVIIKIYFLPKFKNLIYSYFLISYTAFLFLTNMHERYLYPVFIPFIILLFFHPKIFKTKDYLLLSLIHLLNLFNLWFYPSLPFLKKLLEYKSFSLPRLFALILICFWLNFYIKYLKHENKS